MEDFILREKKMYVQMTPDLLYDFTLYHTYSTFSGFMCIILAFAVAIIGLIRVFSGQAHPHMIAFYGAAALLFLAYTPLTLKIRSKSQVRDIEKYRERVEYIFDPAKGIIMNYGDKSEFIPWEKCIKVVSSPKNMGIYYGKNEALILPKVQFGDDFTEIMTVVMANVVGKVWKKEEIRQ